MYAKPFNASRESQDDYCADCANVCACNVVLKDGEDCGDRAEAIPEGLTPEDWDAMTPAEKDTARGLDELTSLPDPTWIDRHSVNCIQCGVMFDEREGVTPEDGEGTLCLTCLPDPEDFDAQVRECLAHWPGIQAVDLDAEPLVRVERMDGKETIFLERDHAEYFVARHRTPGPDNCGWRFAPADGLSHDD